MSWTQITQLSDLTQVLDTKEIVCIYITAPYCFRCKQIEGKIGNIPYDFPECCFFSVDVDAHGDVGDALTICTLPTFLFYNRGKEVYRLEGVPQQRPVRALVKGLREYLGLERY